MWPRHRCTGSDPREYASLRRSSSWPAKCWSRASEGPMQPSLSFFVLCPAILLLASPAAARRTHRSAEEPVHEKCTRNLSEDEAQALRSVQEPVLVRISGLQSLEEDSVWKIVGGRP